MPRGGLVRQDRDFEPTRGSKGPVGLRAKQLSLSANRGVRQRLLCKPTGRAPSASATIPKAMSPAAIQADRPVLAPVDASTAGASFGDDEVAPASG